MFGDDEIETNGRFDTLRNRMDAEIKRQWPKPTAAEQVSALLAVQLPAAIEPKARGVKQWWGRISIHPLWAAVIAGLVVVGVVASFTLVLKVFFG